MSELEGELERRTVTYTSWNLSATKMETKGWHPTTFTYANSGPEKIKEIKVIDDFTVRLLSLLSILTSPSSLLSYLAFIVPETTTGCQPCIL